MMFRCELCLGSPLLIRPLNMLLTKFCRVCPQVARFSIGRSAYFRTVLVVLKCDLSLSSPHLNKSLSILSDYIYGVQK